MRTITEHIALADDDVSLDGLNGVFERIDWIEAGLSDAIQFEVRATTFEQGGSAAFVEVIVEVLDSIADATWGVLVGLVVEEVRRTIGGRQDKE